MHPVFLLSLGISWPRQNTWLMWLLNSHIHKSCRNCLKGNPQLLYQHGHVIIFQILSQKECFIITLTSQWIIQMNSTESHTHTHTHTQSLQLFTFNRLVFLLPDLSAQYLSTFFSFSIFSVFASAKLPQSCPTLCDPIVGSPPGSPALGFARQEHWSGLPFPSPMHESEKWKWSRSVVSDSSDPMNCSLPGSSIHGILQARILEWVVIPFSREDLSVCFWNDWHTQLVSERWRDKQTYWGPFQISESKCL